MGELDDFLERTKPKRENLHDFLRRTSPDIRRSIPNKRIPIPKKLRFKILERDEFKCQYCGCDDKKLHIDHIYPVSKGGKNNPENLITACEDCNLGKSDSVLKTFTRPHKKPDGIHRVILEIIKEYRKN